MAVDKKKAVQAIDREAEVTKGIFADEIEELMDAAGVTQKERSERLGVSPARVSQMLDGDQNLTLATLAGIGWALGVQWWPQPVGLSLGDSPAHADTRPVWLSEPGDIKRIRFMRDGNQSASKWFSSLLLSTVISSDFNDAEILTDAGIQIRREKKNFSGRSDGLDSCAPDFDDCQEVLV